MLSILNDKLKMYVTSFSSMHNEVTVSIGLKSFRTGTSDPQIYMSMIVGRALNFSFFIWLQEGWLQEGIQT